MAEGKKSVLLYCDLIHTVEKMDDKTAGIFFKHYLRYINDLDPKTNNMIVDIAFESVKQNLKRDLKKWESTTGERSKSGQLGNLKRWNKDLYNDVVKGKKTLNESLNIAKSRIAIKKVANVAVTDTVNVTDTDTVNDINKKEEILNSQSWIEQICMKKKLDLIVVTDYLDIFLNDLELKQDLDKSEKDIKNHFINWLNVNIKLLKNEKNGNTKSRRQRFIDSYEG